MVDGDPAALERQRKSENKTSTEASLAAADSLALPSEHDINANEIYGKKSFAVASLAAADSLALPLDEEICIEYALSRDREVKTRKRRKSAIFCFSCFVLVGIIVLSVVLTKTEEDSTRKPVDSISKSIDSIEGGVYENMKDDNIFSLDPKELPDFYFLLESKVHNPAALLDMDTPEGKAFNVLVEERAANISTTLRSIEDSDIQRYALLVLYFGTDGGAWTRTSGWSTRTQAYEEWHGVTCRDSLVTGIDLDGNNLDGKISEDFCLMNRLNFIRLGGNMVELPSCLSKLSELHEVDFRRNEYVGGLPTDLYAMPSLVSLQLSDNEFLGSIDKLFQNAKSNEPIFPKLRSLNLANNNLSGDVPESALRRIPSLDILILHGNPQISGSLNEMCEGDDLSRIDVDCDMVSCKCCTPGENNCPSLLPV